MDQVRRWTPVVVTALAFIYSAVEVISLAVRHNDGPRISAVIVAALATLAGALSVWLTVSNKRRTLFAAAGVILWTIVAIGGVAGTFAHISNSVPGTFVAAPLMFTLIGVVGGAALFYDQFMRLKSPH